MSGHVKKRSPPTGAVTRADVARYAGVSTAVVSYVINNGPRPVAPETAARVRRAIELLEYRPNVSAQALRRGTTEMIGLILSDPSNPFFSEFAAAIGAEAFRSGHALMIATTGASPDMESRLLEDLARRQVDGLIVASIFGRPDLMVGRANRNIPTVWIDAPGPVPGYATVGTDGRGAAVLGVGHLVGEHHHRHVGLLVGPSDSLHPDPREQGWREALRAAGREDGPVARVDWSREGGYAGGRQLLTMRDRPTAIFASSDLLAVGLLRAAHELDLRVPEDLAVIGFDGTKESEYCWPPLTVVAQPVQQMAEAAVRLVLAPNHDRVHHAFAPRLLIRRSCGCPPLDSSAAPDSH